MKKTKVLSIVFASIFFVAGSLFLTNSTKADTAGCYYKKTNCWFRSDTKCSGNGNDCGVADPCGNSQISPDFA